MPSLLSTANAQDTFTYELTDGSFVITYSDGVNKLSVYNGSAVAGTVAGSKVVNGITGSITLAQYESTTIVADNAKTLNNITITAPASCTLKIVCN